MPPPQQQAGQRFTDAELLAIWRDPRRTAADVGSLTPEERQRLMAMPGIKESFAIKNPGDIATPGAEPPMFSPSEFLMGLGDSAARSVAGLGHVGAGIARHGPLVEAVKLAAQQAPSMARQVTTALKEGGMVPFLAAAGRPFDAAAAAGSAVASGAEPDPVRGAARLATAATGFAPAVERMEHRFDEANPSLGVGEALGDFAGPLLLGLGGRVAVAPQKGVPRENIDAILSERPPARVVEGQFSGEIPSRMEASIGAESPRTTGVRSADVPLTPGQRGGAFGVKIPGFESLQKAESFTERSMVAGTRPGTFRRTQQAKLFELSDELGRRIGGFEGTPEALGAFVRDSVNDTLSRMAEVTGEGIREIGQIVDGRRVVGPERTIEVVTPEAVMGLNMARVAVNELNEMRVSRPTPDMVARARQELGLKGPLPGQRDTPSAIGAANRILDKTEALKRQAVRGLYDATTKTDFVQAPGFATKLSPTLTDMGPLQAMLRVPLKEIRATLARNGGILPRATVLGDLALLEAIETADRMQPFSVVQKARTNIAATLRRNTDMITTPSKGLVKMVVAATTKAMRETVRRVGGPELEQRFVRLNNDWRELHVVQDELVLGEIARSTKPEAFTEMLVRGGTEEFASARNFLTRANPEAWDMIRTQLLRDAINEAQRGETVTDTTLSAALRESGIDTGQVRSRRFSPGTLEKQAEDWAGKGIYDIAFNAQERAAIAELVDLGRTALPLGAESGPGITQAAPGLAAGATDMGIVFGFLSGRIVQAASAAAALRFTSRLLFDAEGMTTLRAAARAASRNDVRALAFLSQQLGARADIIASEERDAALQALRQPGVVEEFARQ